MLESVRHVSLGPEGHSGMSIASHAAQWIRFSFDNFLFCFISFDLDL